MIHVAGITLYQLWHPLTGNGYQFWSGIGSDFGQVTLITGLVAVALTWRHHHQCQTEGCKRLGLHLVEGTPHKVCWRCHPILSKHPHHGIPIAVIHKAHKMKENNDQDQ